MIIDSSALIAILQSEPEAERIARAMAAASSRKMATGNVLECAMLMQSRVGDDGENALDLLIAKYNIEIVAMNEDHLIAARKAFRHYGKGRSLACLNFGDCMAYALAKMLDAPLLFKGNDFTHTDISSVPY